MIEPKDLRIGNTIYDRHGNVSHIHAGWFYITQDPKRLEDYSPIPLTSEILEKIGFKRIDHIHGYSFYSLSKSKKNRCHIDIYPEKTSWMSYSVKHCKYVHELQNLVYSLKGDELEVVW